MSAPGWARWLLSRLAGPGWAEEVVGDLEEAHRARVSRCGARAAAVLTSLEALDMAVTLVRLRGPLRGARGSSERPGLAARRARLRLVSWLDVKLGLRMLAKHPGLSVVSVLGMAVAVAIGASVFGVIRGVTSSPVPLHEGDRLVTIQNVGPFGLERSRSTHLHDLARWREGVPALAEVGAYRVVTRNLVVADGAVSPARVVEITTSGFRIARVPPLLGRHLLDTDEREGAAAVVVIGHGVWQERFGGRPDILGRTLQVGGTRHEVVGVMPPGFAFPINNRVWTPLRLDPTDFEVGEAPAVEVFGRLAGGSSLGDAAGQLGARGSLAARERPDRFEGVRPHVYPYAQARAGGPFRWMLYLVQLFVSLLLVVIAVNVATLVYARTIARTGEITVRTALGASRGRIVGQLFGESFLLSSAAAGLGLVVAGFVVRRIELYVRSTRGEDAPFWWDFSLTPGMLAYALGLAVLAAVIIGVVPALGSTGRRLRERLQSAGSGAGPRLGATWTGLVVAQIAFAVAILPVAMSGAAQWGLLDAVMASPFPLEQVLIGRLELDDEAGSADRYTRLRNELVGRFQEQGEVSHVAIIATGPWEDPDLSFELDVPARAPLAATPRSMESASTGHRVGRSRVSPKLFAAYDVPIVAGRPLVESDALSEEPPVLVNRTFVELVLGGGNPLGRRLRFTDESLEATPWHTIVGVVPDFPPSTMANPEAKAYIPLSDAEPGVMSLAIRVRAGDATPFAGRLGAIAAELDPALRLEGLETLAMRESRDRAAFRFMIVTIGVLSLSVLLLAIAGLYALMSFTVVRRQREIGIRTALGARPHRVLRSVLARAAAQLGVGVTIGLVLAFVADRLAGGEMIGGQEALYLPAVAVVMAAVGFLAAWAPARRGLRVSPIEALRSE